MRTEFVPGRIVDGRGFNGSIPGPSNQVTEGDRVRLNVSNELPEPFSMHWHGLEIPVEMHGCGHLAGRDCAGRPLHLRVLAEAERTFFYHSHMPMQEMMGLIGFFVIPPRTPHAPRVDRDFGIVLQEWAILPTTQSPTRWSWNSTG